MDADAKRKRSRSPDAPAHDDGGGDVPSEAPDDGDAAADARLPACGPDAPAADASGAPAADASDAPVADAGDAALRDPTLYRVRKRAPVRPHGGAADIYVTRDMRMGALVQRAQRALRTRREARLHALGAALERCANVALAVERAAGPGAVVVAPRTATVLVVDDYEPLVPGLPLRSKVRAKNALHVTITATDAFV